MDAILTDLKSGFRILTKSPGPAAAAVLVLALGIGLSAATFSIVNGVLYRPLPFEDGHRIYHLEKGDTRGWRFVEPRDYFEWRAQQTSFEELSAYAIMNVFLSDGHTAERYSGAAISADAFAQLRIRPLIGRAFTAADDRPGAEAVVLLGHRVWSEQFGGDPEAVGRPVLVDGRPLVTVDGAQALEVRIAGGTSRILKDLRDGRALTKKGHWPLSGSKLAERRQRYLDIYARTGDLLERRGRQLFLCYGTLLGCHREAGFIAGDDDFDASYVSTAATPTDYRRECYETALGLLDDGLDIAFAINGRMFKVGTERVWIDVGPIWFHRGRGLSFVAHDITPEVIEPLRPTTFSGRKVYIPQNADAFLADTYGADWRTPRQDFRYYRSKEDNRLLSQMWARPSEVREFARKARQAKERNPDAGDFLGIGYPAYPGFNWLVTSEGRMLAADRG